MAAYKLIVDTIRDVCNAINPTGRFIHGRIIDASAAFDGAYSLIVLYPFTTRHPQGEANDSFSNTTILVGFWVQDSPDSNELQREALIASMDTLSDLFIEAMLDKSNVVMTQIDKEPQYQFYQGTVSGFAMQFRLQILQPC
jgi:hypothetical protein